MIRTNIGLQDAAAMTKTSDHHFDSDRAGRIARQLFELIDSRSWEPGSRLPAMRVLAERFSTSVTSVQNAVRVLEARGIVETRARDGVFVVVRSAAIDGSDRREIGIINFAWREDHEQPVNPQHNVSWWHLIELAAKNRFHLAQYQTISLPLYLEDLSNSDQAVVDMLDARADQLAGIVLPGVRALTPRVATVIERYGLPWVAVNPRHSTDMHNHVTADNYGGFSRLGRCLALSGRRNVFIVTTDPAASFSFTDRAMGVYHGFVTAGVPTSGLQVLCTGSTDIYEQHACAVINEKLAQDERPDAIVCMGDYLAIGALQAMRDAGLSVPDDVVVIGGTNFEVAKYTTPTLSVVAQPMERMGWELGNMLLQLLRTGRRRITARRVPTPLILRDSFPLDDALKREAELSYERDMTQFEMEVDDDHTRLDVSRTHTRSR
jgi:DNA-binding LacI/PurR family transcriptional regulator